ncbi:UNVERIFIED_CONTAM: hypothetical protein HDU68_004986, partial [Siphonaria sp. JEL0065]
MEALTQDLQSLVIKHYPVIRCLKIPCIIKFAVLVGGQVEEFQFQRCWSVPGSGSFSELFGSQDSSGGGFGFGGDGGLNGGWDGGDGRTTKRKEGSDGDQQEFGGGGVDDSGVGDKRIRRVTIGPLGEIVDACEDLAISDNGDGREEHDAEDVSHALVQAGLQELSNLSLGADRQELNATSSLVDADSTTPQIVVNPLIDPQRPSSTPSITPIIQPSYSSAATLFGSAETRAALDDESLNKQNAEISAKVDAVMAVCPPEYSREVVTRDVVFTGSVQDTIERIFSGAVKPSTPEDLLLGISKNVDLYGGLGDQQQVIFAATLPGIQEELNGDEKDKTDEKDKGKLSGFNNSHKPSQGPPKISLLPPHAQNHQVQVLPPPPPTMEYVLFSGQLFVRSIPTTLVINPTEPFDASTLVDTIEKPRDADRILEERVNAVMEICPDIPRELVVVDLRYTGSVEDTVERIFSGALKGAK